MQSARLIGRAADDIIGKALEPETPNSLIQSYHPLNSRILLNSGQPVLQYYLSNSLNSSISKKITCIILLTSPVKNIIFLCWDITEIS